MWNEFMELAGRSGVNSIQRLEQSFRPATAVAASISVMGAVVADPLIAWSAAIVAGGTVVVPRVIDWYRAGRAAKREEDAADLARYSSILAAEVSKRIELEAKARDLEAKARDFEGKATEEIKANRHKIKDLEQQLVWMKTAQEKIQTKVKSITPDPDSGDFAIPA